MFAMLVCTLALRVGPSGLVRNASSILQVSACVLLHIQTPGSRVHERMKAHMNWGSQRGSFFSVSCPGSMRLDVHLRFWSDAGS